MPSFLKGFSSPVTTTSPCSPSSPGVSTPCPTSMGQNPLYVTNIHREPEVSPHAFRPPTETDCRSPCPALNTLANHGYLPRDGQNITRKLFLAALQNPYTYHLSKPLAEVLVHGTFFMMHQITSHTLSLNTLAKHGLIEHNASLVHKDAEPGHIFAPTRCDTELLNELLDDGVLTLEKVACRRTKLERVSPLDVVHQEVARGEWALVLDIFGREHGGKLLVDELRVWLEQNRFPDGWKPGHEQGLLATVLESRKIRKEMNKFRKEYENSVVLAATERSLACADIAK